MLLLTTYLSACKSFGSNPSKEDRVKYQNSNQFNQETRKFENRLPQLVAKMQKRLMNWQTFKEWMSPHPDVEPKGLLPAVRPDFNQLSTKEGNPKVVWFGHSSFFLQIDGKNMLIDPVFSDHASPIPFLVPRFQKPIVTLSEIPDIDYIVISHDHYDHLDMESIRFFKNKNTTFLVPLGVGSHLRYWGIDQDRIKEHDWWQSSQFADLKFTATPAQHFSGRLGINGNQTLWASWVIQGKSTKIFFSGDTGYDQHFKEIGDLYGPFDIAFLECGQYNEKWREVHMMPEEAVKAYRDLSAKKLFPVHWAMFKLSTHAWYDPIERLHEYASRGEINLMAPKIGELLHIHSNHQMAEWWKSVERSPETSELAEAE